MLFRLTASVMLILREVKGQAMDFYPARKIGLSAALFLYFLPLALLFLPLRLSFKTSPTLLAMAPLQFLGSLWVVALGEDFLVWGLFQRWIADWTGRAEWLCCASVAFGLSHSGFATSPTGSGRSSPPCLAGFAARPTCRPVMIRAPMVTHALVITVWRTLLS